MPIDVSHPSVRIKNITVDAADPNRLAEFWSFALSYVIQPPPDGFDTWEDFADDLNLSPEDRERYAAVIDPHGIGPRILFQKVPEGKVAKNRWHLDIDPIDPSTTERGSADALEIHIQALITRGATEVRRFCEPVGRWVLMADPEGNEFCVVTQSELKLPTVDS